MILGEDSVIISPDVRVLRRQGMKEASVNQHYMCANDSREQCGYHLRWMVMPMKVHIFTHLFIALYFPSKIYSLA